ncbi:ATP-binding protein [Rickettsia canadensis]|uniref:ATP-binding protein n=1 Tax=Rickettsia canadensis TaxID=788 RepID=UPI001E638E2D|nr:ATP-binding protein [Rickettsia canadensis]
MLEVKDLFVQVNTARQLLGRVTIIYLLHWTSKCLTQVLTTPEAKLQDKSINYPDFKDIKGQKIAKRALEIVASKWYNLLMFGPPGTSKSSLAGYIPSILSKMSIQEILECSTITSIAGKLLLMH